VIDRPSLRDEAIIDVQQTACPICTGSVVGVLRPS